MNVATPNQTVNLTLPYADVSFLRTLSKKMGWSVRAERKSGIEKGLDDIRKKPMMGGYIIYYQEQFFSRNNRNSLYHIHLKEIIP